MTCLMWMKEARVIVTVLEGTCKRIPTWRVCPSRCRLYDLLHSSLLPDSYLTLTCAAAEVGGDEREQSIRRDVGQG